MEFVSKKIAPKTAGIILAIFLLLISISFFYKTTNISLFNEESDLIEAIDVITKHDLSLHPGKYYERIDK